MKKIKWFMMIFLLLFLFGCAGNIPSTNNYNCFTKELLVENNNNPESRQIHTILMVDDNQLYYGLFNLKNNNELDGEGVPVEIRKISLLDRKVSTYNTENKLYAGCFGLNFEKNRNGNFFILNGNSKIDEYDINGNLISSNDITDTCQLNKDNNAIVLYSDEKYKYVETHKSIYVIDDNMTVVYSINTEDNKYSLIKIQNEVLFWDFLTEKFFCYDDEKKDVVQNDCYQYILNKIKKNENSYFYQGDNLYDVYIENDGILYGAKNKKIEKILSLKELDIEDCGNIASDKNGGFIYATDKGIYNLAPSDEEYSDQRKIINIAGIYDDMLINDMLNSFNNASTEYKAVYTNYQNENSNPQEALLKIYEDILAGAKIDMVLFAGLNKDLFEEKDLLIDLNDYFNKSTVVSKEMFLPKVCDAYENEEGKIYSVFYSFRLNGFLSNRSIEFNDIEDLNNILDDGKLVYNEFDSLFTLNKIVSYSKDFFIDEDNKKINIKNELASFLSIIKKQKKSFPFDENQFGEELIETDKCIYTYYDVGSMLDLIYYYNFYGNKLKLENMYGDKFNIVPDYKEFGVINSTDNIAGVYSFLDFHFDHDQYNKSKGIGFPVLVDTFNENIDYYLANECKIDDIAITPISEEAAANIKNIIESSVYIEPMPDKYLDIILEEADLYFEDKKSLDDTVKAIENRVTTALNE